MRGFISLKTSFYYELLVCYYTDLVHVLSTHTILVLPYHAMSAGALARVGIIRDARVINTYVIWLRYMVTSQHSQYQHTMLQGMSAELKFIHLLKRGF